MNSFKEWLIAFSCAVLVVVYLVFIIVLTISVPLYGTSLTVLTIIALLTYALKIGLFE